MSPPRICGLAVTAVVASLASVPAAGPLNIRLATFAPANSEWHAALLDMADGWARSTQGRVKLTVYPGGQQGPEPAIVKYMRAPAAHIQAALLLPPGLAEIDEAFNAIGIPFFFESEEELRAVLRELAPLLARRLEAKGFHLINWGHAGWVQIFSKRRIETLDDLKRARLYTTDGDDRMVRWYKSHGFNPQALSFNDIPAQLKLPTGMIDTAPSPPYGALTLQFFRDAPYMLEIRVAPLVTATIVTAETWRKISREDQARMLEIARATEARIFTRVPALDAESIAAMEKRGLKVVRLSEPAAADFRAAAEKLTASLRGGMVPADAFDLAVRAREAFRRTRP